MKINPAKAWQRELSENPFKLQQFCAKIDDLATER